MSTQKRSTAAKKRGTAPQRSSLTIRKMEPEPEPEAKRGISDKQIKIILRRADKINTTLEDKIQPLLAAATDNLNYLAETVEACATALNEFMEDVDCLTASRRHAKFKKRKRIEWEEDEDDEELGEYIGSSDEDEDEEIYSDDEEEEEEEGDEGQFDDYELEEGAADELSDEEEDDDDE